MDTLSGFTRLSNLFMLGENGQIGRITDEKIFQPEIDLSRRFADYTPEYLRQYEAHLNDHGFRIGLIYHSRRPHQWGSETLLFADEVVRMLYPLSGTRQTGLTTFQAKKSANSVYYGIDLLLEYALKDSPGVPVFVPVLYDRGMKLGQYADVLHETLAAEDPATPVIEVLNLIGPATSRNNMELFVNLNARLSSTFVKKEGRKSVETKLMEGMRATGAAPAPTPPPPPQTLTPFTAPTSAAPVAAVSALAPPTHWPQWYNKKLHDVTCDKLQKFLPSREHVEIELIRYFVRFQGLSSAQLKALAAGCPVYTAPTGSVLLEPGTTDQWNLYLLQGDIQVIAADGEQKTLSGGSEKARNAIAALKPRKYKVTTLSRVRFLWIHENMVNEIQQLNPTTLELL